MKCSSKISKHILATLTALMIFVSITAFAQDAPVYIRKQIPAPASGINPINPSPSTPKADPSGLFMRKDAASAPRLDEKKIEPYVMAKAVKKERYVPYRRPGIPANLVVKEKPCPPEKLAQLKGYLKRADEVIMAQKGGETPGPQHAAHIGSNEKLPELFLLCGSLLTKEDMRISDENSKESSKKALQQRFHARK